MAEYVKDIRINMAPLKVFRRRIIRAKLGRGIKAVLLKKFARYEEEAKRKLLILAQQLKQSFIDKFNSTASFDAVGGGSGVKSSSTLRGKTGTLRRAIIASIDDPIIDSETGNIFIGFGNIDTLDQMTIFESGKGLANRGLGYWRLFEYGGQRYGTEVYSTAAAGQSFEYRFIPEDGSGKSREGFMVRVVGTPIGSGSKKLTHGGVPPVRPIRRVWARIVRPVRAQVNRVLKDATSAFREI